MSETRDDVIRKLAQHLFYDSMDIIDHTGDVTWGHLSSRVHLYWTGKAERLLSMNPELAIVDREAELRVVPPDLRDALLREGWVKEVKDV